MHGVFSADEVSLSLMVGDSVTLRTDETEIQGAEKLQWRIQGENKFIAIIDRETSETSVPGNEEERFSGRLGVNSTTGSLTITNLRTTHSRVYELQIKNSKGIKSKIFNITVKGGMKTVSVKKGDSVTLDSGLFEMKGYDLILWMSEGHVIAEINRNTNQALFSPEEKFKGRLQRKHQTGSLIISDTRTTDSGDYQLNMRGSTYTLQRTISLTVTNVTVTEHSVWKTVSIVVVSLVIIGSLVMIIYKKKICCKNGGAI